MRFFSLNQLKFGIAATSVMFLGLVVFDFLGNDGVKMLVILALQFVVWYLGIRAKKVHQNGKLSFKAGVIEGYKMAIVFALSSPMVFLLYYFIRNFSIITGYSAPMIGEPVPGLTNIIVYMLAQLWICLFMGTLFGVIASAMLKATSFKVTN